ncbi:hypothetical protein GWK47_022940 [Chionoecetes opilio]|uniref:Uncharacterized protein n=1 Tax=Chionoecetes opilio TaxID=41210 RepID=A0A8J4XRV7_CHIOP|nr:hypothetical protein GWK47_022940 [Chionoecetes opilio]
MSGRRVSKQCTNTLKRNGLKKHHLAEYQARIPWRRLPRLLEKHTRGSVTEENHGSTSGIPFDTKFHQLIEEKPLCWQHQYKPLRSRNVPHWWGRKGGIQIHQTMVRTSLWQETIQMGDNLSSSRNMRLVRKIRSSTLQKQEVRGNWSELISPQVCGRHNCAGGPGMSYLSQAEAKIVKLQQGIVRDLQE